jgi:hypothetical protein
MERIIIISSNNEEIQAEKIPVDFLVAEKIEFIKVISGNCKFYG